MKRPVPGDALRPGEGFQKPLDREILDVVCGREIAVMVSMAMGAVPLPNGQGFGALQGFIDHPQPGQVWVVGSNCPA